MHIYNQLTYINNSSLGLGFFDGLHLGHKVVLKNVIHVAKKYNTQSVVILFNEHPVNVLSSTKIPEIITLDEKIKMLDELGIDNVVILDFKSILSMKADDYLQDILVKYFSPIAITTGFNHSFGFNKEGNSKFLRDNQEKYSYKYFEIPPFVMEEAIVSSSVIRSRILLGDFIFANKLLDYNFFINGKVIVGDKVARNLGFPSANIEYDENKIQIPFGVYYVKVTYNEKIYDGILNYGYAPTLDLSSKLKTEVHILDFDKNIYGENIKISFITKIRNQMKFENIEKLKAQLLRDKAFAEIYKHFLGTNFNISYKKFHN